jgi:hypothetical protein
VQVYDQLITWTYSEGRRFNAIVRNVTVSRRAFADRGLLISQVKGDF